jgi:hypothetical protein
MSKSLNKWIEEMKNSLKNKGYTKEIPYDVFCSEFMILSGYSKDKVIEWVNNFNTCKLISIKDNIVHWK